ncbi:MAG TPA: type III pantothenate kinase [Usitatibacter sp.]|jgi:type III pantothenate kinase|nr:type III pantothenate kinase [Usitatibacter sp.]
MTGAATALLAIDAGNTRIKWGIHDGIAWNGLGALASAESKRLADAWADLPPVERAVACSVARDDVFRDVALACEARGVPLLRVESGARQLGVVNGYRDPGQLGADRWAALIAAHAVGDGHKLVANAGTALTVDALAADGRFLGGLIVAGPALMRRSLSGGTARLPLEHGAFEEFPTTTAAAIASGALQACVGALQRMRHAMTERGMPPTHVLLSGGAAGEIAPLLPMPFTMHENLVLDGLARIARNS